MLRPINSNPRHWNIFTAGMSSKPLKASASHPEQEQSFSCFFFLLKTEVPHLLWQAELAAQGFAIPVIILQLLNSATYRETKAGLTVDV